jgi:hypothetical protein
MSQHVLPHPHRHARSLFDPMADAARKSALVLKRRHERRAPWGHGVVRFGCSYRVSDGSWIHLGH